VINDFTFQNGESFLLLLLLLLQGAYQLVNYHHFCVYKYDECGKALLWLNTNKRSPFATTISQTISAFTTRLRFFVFVPFLLLRVYEKAISSFGKFLFYSSPIPLASPSCS